MDLASVRLLQINQSGNEVGLLPYQASLGCLHCMLCLLCTVIG